MFLESGKLRPTLGVHFREVSIVKELFIVRVDCIFIQLPFVN